EEYASWQAARTSKPAGHDRADARPSSSSSSSSPSPSPPRDAGGAPPSLATLWELRWKRSPQYQKYVLARLARAAPAPTPRPARPAAAARTSPATPRKTGARASRARQTVILARRYLDLLVNDRRNLLLILLQAPIIGALLSLVSGADVLTAMDAPYDAKKLLFL